MGRQDGFTLVELLAVIVVMAILVAIVAGFQVGARERANDATAKANLRAAIPAIEAYRADTGSYAGMTEAVLKTQYGPGMAAAVVSTSANAYCIRAIEGGSAWFRRGPDGLVTKTACS